MKRTLKITPSVDITQNRSEQVREPNTGKKHMKCFAMLAGAMVGATVVALPAQAEDSLQFSGTAAFNGQLLGNISQVVDFSGAGALVTTLSSGAGLFAGASAQDVTWQGTPLVFATGSPLAAAGSEPINDLFSVPFDGQTYDFSLSSINFYSVGNPAPGSGLDQNLEFSGLGELSGPGYAKPATIDISITDSGGVVRPLDTFGFSGSISTAPDGGETFALLGGALVGLQVLRRKLLC
jgi:hypothetical protein